MPRLSFLKWKMTLLKGDNLPKDNAIAFWLRITYGYSYFPPAAAAEEVQEKKKEKEKKKKKW